MDKRLEKYIKNLSKKEKTKSFEIKHRYDPRTLKSPDSLIKETKSATAEFLDFYYYSLMTSTLIERLDETIDLFYPERWALLRKTRENNEDLSSTCLHLETTNFYMKEMCRRTENKCIVLWEAVLCNLVPGTSERIFDQDIKISTEDFRRIRNNLEDTYPVMMYEYNGIIEKSFNIYKNELKNILKINDLL